MATIPAIGDVSIIGDAPNIQITGVEGTGTVGTVELRTFQRVPVNNIGILAQTELGPVETKLSVRISVTGLSSSARVGSVLVYDQIIPDPGTVWTGVTPGPASIWSEEEPVSGVTWTEIAA